MLMSVEGWLGDQFIPSRTLESVGVEGEFKGWRSKFPKLFKLGAGSMESEMESVLELSEGPEPCSWDLDPAWRVWLNREHLEGADWLSCEVSKLKRWGRRGPREVGGVGLNHGEK
jgi:hypothetical protein